MLAAFVLGERAVGGDESSRRNKEEEGREAPLPFTMLRSMSSHANKQEYSKCLLLGTQNGYAGD
ncbi:hypothetical protein BDA96_09G228900 [Sorghum bicolor]|uniref:Uncharacterized protein n=1 Tax=Sorghum bicolor TaxID=4558 RepID=A0A921QC73_SORBI|nr:hypothetical protein BDA96_09G228900 [Sorghum bicolor]